MHGHYDDYGGGALPPEEDFVPKPWTKGIDQNGQAYYVNTETGQIRRQPPVTAGFQTYQKANAFIDPEQWDLVIETMASTIHPQQQLRIFQKLKKIAEKMITKDDPKYRTLYLNNPKLQHTVLAFDGGLEFLYNLGFEPHVTARDKLVCHDVNVRVVKACLICLEEKIEMLTYEESRHNLSRKGSMDNLQQHLQHLDIAHQQSQVSNQSQPSHSAYSQMSAHSQNSGNSASSYPDPSQFPHQQLQHQQQVIDNLSGLGFAPMINKPAPPSHSHAHSGHSGNQINLRHAASHNPEHAHKYGQPPSHPHDLHRSVSDQNNTYNRPAPPPRPVPPRENAAGTMYKTFIFIRHGNSIWNSFKAGGRKRKLAALAVGVSEYFKTKSNPANHADTWVVDAPLSRVGIDEAYGLSRFLGRHLTLRQFESLADLEHHQSLATPIKDALRLIQTGVLDKYSSQLKRISPELYQNCREIKSIMNDAHAKIQRIMLETEARRAGQLQIKGKDHTGKVISHVTKGGDFIPDKKGDEDGKVEKEDVLLQNGYGHGGHGHGHDNGYNELLHDRDESEYKGKKQPALSRPFSHVVIANQVEQVEEQDDLEMPLEMEWVLDQMVDASNNSIVATSNLRRAISTAVIGLWDRFCATQEKIHILPCLQELGMNVDTHTPILEAQVPQVSNFEKTSKKLNVAKLTEFYSHRLVVEQAMGGKTSLMESGTDTKQRLDFFCDWAFKKNDRDGKPYNTVIACGHSHWMRSFFKNFLPKDTQSMAGKRKIQNCGVVGFRMMCHIGPENQRSYEIVGRSITPIYRGFL